MYSDLKFAPFLLLRMFTIETARTSNRYNLGYTANTVAKIAALYSAQLGDSNELRLAAIGRYGDTPPYRYLKTGVAVFLIEKHCRCRCLLHRCLIYQLSHIVHWPEVGARTLERKSSTRRAVRLLQSKDRRGRPNRTRTRWTLRQSCSKGEGRARVDSRDVREECHAGGQ